MVAKELERKGADKFLAIVGLNGQDWQLELGMNIGVEGDECFASFRFLA